MRGHKVNSVPVPARLATLIVNRECFRQAYQFVDPKFFDLMLEGYPVPSRIDPEFWLQVKLRDTI